MPQEARRPGIVDFTIPGLSFIVCGADSGVGATTR